MFGIDKAVERAVNAKLANANFAEMHGTLSKMVESFKQVTVVMDTVAERFNTITARIEAIESKLTTLEQETPTRQAFLEFKRQIETDLQDLPDFDTFPTESDITELKSEIEDLRNEIPDTDEFLTDEDSIVENTMEALTSDEDFLKTLSENVLGAALTKLVAQKEVK